MMGVLGKQGAWNADFRDEPRAGCEVRWVESQRASLILADGLLVFFFFFTTLLALVAKGSSVRRQQRGLSHYIGISQAGSGKRERGS